MRKAGQPPLTFPRRPVSEPDYLFASHTVHGCINAQYNYVVICSLFLCFRPFNYGSKDRRQRKPSELFHYIGAEVDREVITSQVTSPNAFRHLREE